MSGSASKIFVPRSENHFSQYMTFRVFENLNAKCIQVLRRATSRFGDGASFCRCQKMLSQFRWVREEHHFFRPRSLAAALMLIFGSRTNRSTQPKVSKPAE